MKTLRGLIVSLVLFAMVAPFAHAEIEAVKGKRYTLRKNHGPWMVMVAAIRDVKEETRRVNGGMTAWEAADEIVYELRKKGIPAYTYVQQEESEEISSPNSRGGRRYIAQQGYISVLAANFKSNTDKDAKAVLAYVKNKFNPAFLSDEKSGGILPKTPGRPSPFSRAFLTINPLYEGDVRNVEKDDLMASLNAGQKNSLLSNKGKYTLVIASFHGGSVMQVGANSSSKAMSLFENRFGSSLDICAEDAMLLTEKMRNAKKFGYDTNFETYVFHEEHKSLVTIGSFDSKDDPRIRQYYTLFAGKPVRNPLNGEEVIAGERFTVPRVIKNGGRAEFEWVFDAEPKLIEIPRLPK